LDYIKKKKLFPENAINAGVSGIVVLDLFIDTEGKLHSVTVLEEKPKGYGFAFAAEKAIRKMKFKPGTKYGQPFPAELQQTVKFELR
jgi:TonB family protein